MEHKNFFSSQVEVDTNMYLNFEIHGTNDLSDRILFIQGMNTGIGGWLEQIEYFKNYQICVFDNRGVGKSSEYKGRTTTQLYASDVEKLVKYLGWEKFHVVGLSMGGMIAQEYAYLEPEKVKSLTLCATYHNPYNNLPSFDIFKNIYNYRSSYEDIAIHNMFSKEFVENNYELAAKLFQSKTEKDGEVPLSTRISQFLAVLTHNMQDERLNTIKHIPTWVCTGTSDYIVNPSNTLRMIDILKPKKHTIYPGIGHSLNMEIAEQFNKDLQKFIDEHK